MNCFRASSSTLSLLGIFIFSAILTKLAWLRAPNLSNRKSLNDPSETVLFNAL